MSQSITVSLTENFSLDAGCYDVSEKGNHLEYRITPPETPMFEQVIDFLWRQPQPYYAGFYRRHLAVGFAALTMRWGSYLSALCAPEFAAYSPDAQYRNASLVADAEMQRLNIEISANIAYLGRLSREDSSKFYDLLDRAYEYLPMTLRNARRNHELNDIVSQAHLLGSVTVMAAENPLAAKSSLVALGISESEIYFSPNPLKVTPVETDRVIANYLTNWAWRNTEIEDYHAGTHLNIDAPLLPQQRRFSKMQERKLIRVLSDNSSEIILNFASLYDPDFRLNDPKFDFVLGYPDSASALYNAGFLAGYPHNWTTTEKSSEVILTHYFHDKMEQQPTL